VRSTPDPSWRPLSPEQKARLDARWEASERQAAEELARMSPEEREELRRTTRQLGERMQSEAGG
jgi:DNA-binding MarR family transcriptional regulator